MCVCVWKKTQKPNGSARNLENYSNLNDRDFRDQMYLQHANTHTHICFHHFGVSAKAEDGIDANKKSI